MNGTENDRLELAVDRLLDGQREALGVVRRMLEAPDAPMEEALWDLQDILQGASDDTRAILGTDEGEP